MRMNQRRYELRSRRAELAVAHCVLNTITAGEILIVSSG